MCILRRMAPENHTLRCSAPLGILGAGALVALTQACGAPAATPPPAQTAKVGAATAPERDEVVLPSEFVADRIFVRPTTIDGRTLRFYTDSGGGSQFVYPDVVQRLGLTSAPLEGSPEKLVTAPIPEWRDGAGIPAPLAIHQPAALRSRYVVVERDRPFTSAGDDGFLGQGWFGGRVWTFDYPGKRLLWHPRGSTPAHRPEQRVPLHFRLAADGQPAMHFARISVEIDDEQVDVLFDTGATIDVSPAAEAALGPGPESRGTSFIAESKAARWRSRHPDWRFVEKAERGTGSAIIEVPKIRVAGQEVGPVWFTLRKDPNLHEFMSSMMDARIDGALGGSALRFFRVTADYPNRVAIFAR